VRPEACVDSIEIPNRSLFRQPEVCEIAQVQPYVLRSWEAEFPDLGVAKTEGGPRVYRRTDVARVLRIKQLVFVEGLTLAGARRKLIEERALSVPEDDGAEHLEELLGSDARERIQQVRRGLRELAAILAHRPGERDVEFRLAAPMPKSRTHARPVRPAAKVVAKKKAAAKRR
jgi:DNA-binding transcriptional MerR regulator